MISRLPDLVIYLLHHLNLRLLWQQSEQQVDEGGEKMVGGERVGGARGHMAFAEGEEQPAELEGELDGGLRVGSCGRREEEQGEGR